MKKQIVKLKESKRSKGAKSFSGSEDDEEEVSLRLKKAKK